jgi:cytochrome c553
MNTDTSDPAETWAFPVSSGASAATTSEHSLGIEALIWGSGDISATPNAGDSTTTLECVSCHDPHAYGRTYRMLKPQPAGAGISGHGSTEYAMVTDILAAGNLPYDTDDYAADIEVYAPDVLDELGNPVMIQVFSPYAPGGAAAATKYSQQMNLWCSSCHTRYHATKSGRDGVGSTDTGDAIFAFQHKTGDEVIDRRTPDVDGLPILLDGDASLILDVDSAAQPLFLDALATTEAHALDGAVAYYIADTSPVEVEEGDPAIAVPVFLGDGTAVGNLLEQDYEHEAYSTSCGYVGANCHGGTKDFNKMLSCLSCHVSHGTSATMTPYAQIPWPGEAATTEDGLPGMAVDLIAMDNWLGVGDDDLTAQYLDSDWGARSSLLRLDNRGVCQNAWCHPKGNDNMHFGPDGFEQGSDFDYGGGGDH